MSFAKGTDVPAPAEILGTVRVWSGSIPTRVKTLAPSLYGSLEINFI